MRIVCLIRDEPPLRYFANALHEVHGVDLAVVETGPASPSGIRARLRAMGPAGLPEAVRHKLTHEARDRARQLAFDRSFGGAWRTLMPPSLVVESVNDERVLSRLQEMSPDVLLDHGTSIVGPSVIDTAPLALNLHWGLSPYYRGTHCTEWALINWDPRNIGVTIHRLSREIDGGGIVAQARAAVTSEDTVHSINMQLTRLGTELVDGALGLIAAERELEFVEQDLGRGFLTYNRQWNPRLRRHVERLERDGSLARMLQSPAREERLPIVAASHRTIVQSPGGRSPDRRGRR